MLRIVAALLLLGAMVLPLRWYLARHDSLGRAIPFPAISTGLLLALAVAAITPVVLKARLEGRLSEVATAVVGSPVKVRCQGFGEAFVDAGAELGYVAFGPDGTPERQTLIKRDQCRDLSAYLRSDKREPSHDQVVAVHILTHEAMHMRGTRSESVTECHAVQHNVTVAELLGAATEDARALAVRYWERVYPRMPGDYRSADCGPSEALDLGLPGAPWEPAAG